MNDLTKSTRKMEKLRRRTLAQDLLFEAEAAAEQIPIANDDDQ